MRRSSPALAPLKSTRTPPLWLPAKVMSPRMPRRTPIAVIHSHGPSMRHDADVGERHAQVVEAEVHVDVSGRQVDPRVALREHQRAAATAATAVRCGSENGVSRPKMAHSPAQASGERQVMLAG